VNHEWARHSLGCEPAADVLHNTILQGTSLFGFRPLSAVASIRQAREKAPELRGEILSRQAERLSLPAGTGSVSARDFNLVFPQQAPSRASGPAGGSRYAGLPRGKAPDGDPNHRRTFLAVIEDGSARLGGFYSA
jgi:hypothetical protein